MYTLLQLNTAIKAGQVSLAKHALKEVLNDFYYKRENPVNLKTALRIKLYLYALSNWRQNADGSQLDTTINPYSQESLDAMVGYLYETCIGLEPVNQTFAITTLNSSIT